MWPCAHRYIHTNLLIITLFANKANQREESERRIKKKSHRTDNADRLKCNNKNNRYMGFVRRQPHKLNDNSFFLFFLFNKLRHTQRAIVNELKCNNNDNGTTK